MTDEIAQQLGFKDADELLRLVAALDLSRPGAPALFKAWQENDGTKQALLTVFPEIDEDDA